MSKSSGGGLGGRQGQDDYIVGRGVPVADTLTAGGAPNSNAPGRRREDDVNLVVVGKDVKAVQEDNQNGVQITDKVQPGVSILFIDAWAVRGSSSPNQNPVKTDGKSDALDTTAPGAVAIPAPAAPQMVSPREMLYGKVGNNPNFIKDKPGAIQSSTGDGQDLLLQASAPVVIPIDLRQTSRGERMSNKRGRAATPGGPPGTGIGKNGDPAHSVTPRTSAIAFDPTGSTCDAGEKVPTLKSRGGGGSCGHGAAIAFGTHPEVTHALTSEGHDASEDGTGRGTPIIAIDLPKVTHPLTSHGTSGATEDGTGRGTPIIAFDTTQLTHGENRSNPQPGDPCHPLAAKGHPPTIAEVPLDSKKRVAPTLRGYDHGAQGQHNDDAASMLMVRRLSPTECERLQGVPDGWTCTCGVNPNCPQRRVPPWVDASTFNLGGCGHSACGCKCPDSPRYRALGNAVAVPVVRWIADRILPSSPEAATR